jgi:hypothetical protein
MDTRPFDYKIQRVARVPFRKNHVACPHGQFVHAGDQFPPVLVRQIHKQGKPDQSVRRYHGCNPNGREAGGGAEATTMPSV